MKKGFSLIMSVGIVFVFLVLTTIVIINYGKTNEMVEFKKFASELFMIQDRVDEYVFKHNKYPIKEEVLFSYDDIDIASRNQFNDLKEENKLYKFYKLDFNALDITLNGRGFSDNTTDIYAFSLDNNQVYYLKGFNYDRFYHYTFNNEMYKLTGFSRVK